MHIFDRFDDLIDDNFPIEVVIHIWKSKLVSVGLILTPKDELTIERIIKEQLSECSLDFVNENFEGTDFKDEKEVIEFIKTSLSESINEAEDAIPQILPDVLNDTIADSTEDIFLDLKSDQDRMLQLRDAQKKEFEYFLYNFWHRPLKSFDTLLKIISEILERFSGIILGSTKYEAIIPLYIRACQTTSEISCLLNSGYSDGAYARWRTLHEICVTSIFILEHGDDLAERYLDYEHVDTYFAAKKYYSVYGIKDAEDRNNLKACKEAFKAVEKKYGRNFTGQYGWASKALNDSRPNFSKIEKKLKLDYKRPDFKLACDNIHAGVRGNHFRLGGTNDYPLLMGPSFVGLSEAGINTVISLNLMFAYLLTDNTTIESTINMKVFQKFADVCITEFVEAEEDAQNYNNGSLIIDMTTNHRNNLHPRRGKRSLPSRRRKRL